MVADAVIDDDTVSVPTMVTVYVPFAAVAGVLLGGADEAPPLAQPVAVNPTAAKISTPASVPSLRERRPTMPTNSSPISPIVAMLACVAGRADSGCESLLEPFAFLPPLLPGPLLLARAIAGVVQAEATVLTVKVAMTAAVPDTVVFGSVKHPFERVGLLETVHATVPVYPFCGVTVTVEVPELPAATVTLVAASLNALLPATITVTELDEGI